MSNPCGCAPGWHRYGDSCSPPESDHYSVAQHADGSWSAAIMLGDAVLIQCTGPDPLAALKALLDEKQHIIREVCHD